METITQLGKIYQIGQLYQDEFGEIMILLAAAEIGFSMVPVVSGDVVTRKQATPINPTQLGTIEDAPIELEDGEWYMCDLESGPAPLQWNEGSWFFSDGCTFDTANTASVIPLHKMVKAEIKV